MLCLALGSCRWPHPFCQVTSSSKTLKSLKVSGFRLAALELITSLPANRLLEKNPVLVDLTNSDDEEDIPTPVPTTKSAAQEMVSISKTEAEQWKVIKAFLLKNGMEDLMGRPKADSAGEVPKPTASNGTVQVGHGYAVSEIKMNDIIGNQNLPKGKSTQTTPSLAESKWGYGPRAAKAAPLVPLKEKFTTPHSAINGRGQHTSNPIDLSSASPSSYYSTNQDLDKPPPPMRSSGRQSKPVVNPFAPQESNTTEDDSDLDYGDLVKPKFTPKASSSSKSQSVFRFNAVPTAQSEAAALEDRRKAETKSAIERHLAQARLQEEARAKQREDAALRLRERIVRKREENDALKLDEEEVVPKPAPMPTVMSTTATRQPIKKIKDLGASQWATDTTAPPTRTAPALNLVHSQPARSVPTAAAWCPAPPLKVKSPNKSRFVETGSASSSTGGRTTLRNSNSPIFGDGRNVAHNPKPISSSNANPFERHEPGLKYDLPPWFQEQEAIKKAMQQEQEESSDSEL